MLVSANEIEQSTHKACVARQLGHDRAADLAAGTVWLAKRGIDGVEALVVMLDAGGFATPIDCRASGNNLHCPDVRPAMEGIAAIDWLAAGGRDAVVHCEATDHPAILLGLLGQAAASHNLAFTVEATEDGSSGIVDAAPDTSAVEAMSSGFRILLAGAPRDAHAPEPGHLDIDGGAWERLSAMAFETYVPSSDASRLKGAGAGLVDND